MTESFIYTSKNDAIQSLYANGVGFDGKHTMARYWADSNQTEIASVIGICHNTNGVTNVEIKDLSLDTVDEQYQSIIEMIQYIQQVITNNNENIENLRARLEACCG